MDDMIQKLPNLSENQKKTVLEAMAIISLSLSVSSTSTNSNKSLTDKTVDSLESSVSEIQAQTTKPTMKQVTLDQWLKKNRYPTISKKGNDGENSTSTSKKGVDGDNAASVSESILDSEVESVCQNKLNLRTSTPKTLISKHLEKQKNMSDTALPDCSVPQSNDNITNEHTNTIGKEKRLRVMLSRENVNAYYTKISDNQEPIISDSLNASFLQKNVAPSSVKNNKSIGHKDNLLPGSHSPGPLCSKKSKLYQTQSMMPVNANSEDSEDDNKDELQSLIDKMSKRLQNDSVSKQKHVRKKVKTSPVSPVVSIEKLSPLIRLPDTIDSNLLDKNLKSQSGSSSCEKNYSRIFEQDLEKSSANSLPDDAEESLLNSDFVTPVKRKVQHKKNKRLTEQNEPTSEQDNLILQSVNVITEAQLQFENIMPNLKKGSPNKDTQNNLSVLNNLSETSAKSYKKNSVKNKSDPELHPPIPTMKIRFQKGLLCVDSSNSDLTKISPDEKIDVTESKATDDKDINHFDHLSEIIDSVVNNLSENQTFYKKNSKPKHSSTFHKDIPQSDAISTLQSSLLNTQPELNINNDTANSTDKNKAQVKQLKNVTPVKKCQIEANKIFPSKSNTLKEDDNPKIKVSTKSPSTGYSSKNKQAISCIEKDKNREMLQKTVTPTKKSHTEENAISPSYQQKMVKSSQTKNVFKSPSAVCNVIKKGISPKSDIPQSSMCQTRRSSKINENSNTMQQMEVSSTTQDTVSGQKQTKTADELKDAQLSCSREKILLAVTPQLGTQTKSRKVEENCTDLQVKESEDQVIIYDNLEKSVEDLRFEVTPVKDSVNEIVTRQGKYSKLNTNLEPIPHKRSIRTRSSFLKRTTPDKDNVKSPEAVCVKEKSGLGTRSGRDYRTPSAEGENLLQINYEEAQGLVESSILNTTSRRKKILSSMTKILEDNTHQQDKLDVLVQDEFCVAIPSTLVENLEKSAKGKITSGLNLEAVSSPVPKRVLRKRNSSRKQPPLESNLLDNSLELNTPNDVVPMVDHLKELKELDTSKSLSGIDNIQHNSLNPLKRLARKRKKSCKCCQDESSNKTKDPTVETIKMVSEPNDEKLNCSDDYNLKKISSVNCQDFEVCQPLLQKIPKTRSQMKVKQVNEQTDESCIDKECSEANISEILSTVDGSLHQIAQQQSTSNSVKVSNNLQNELDITTAQCNYSAFSKLQRLCSSYGMDINDLFKDSEVKETIKSITSSDALFFIRGHKLAKSGFNAYLHPSRKELTETLLKLKQNTP